MATIVERLEDKNKSLDLRLAQLEVTHIEKDAFQKTINELRQYAEERDRQQSEALKESFGERLGTLRAGILGDTERLLKDHLSEWVETSLQPMVNEIIVEREKLRDEQRQARWNKIKSRVSLYTSVVLFLAALASLFFSFQNNSPGDIHRFEKAAERLTDITN